MSVVCYLLQGGESMSYQNNAPRSADVVFVVEQGGCAADPGLRLRDLPRLLDRSLEARQLYFNRFALVGFGGDEDSGFGEAQEFIGVGAGVFDSHAKVATAFQG